ncbi:MAG: hypothetical protein AAGE59_27695 [Cyanobacteria bacterium P01_F01_bin.86]
MKQQQPVVFPGRPGFSICEDWAYPLLATEDEYVVHGFSYTNYLDELDETAQQDIYSNSSGDLQGA